jgi:multicomponent Na+:H+ antiporter subunit G
MREVVAHVLLLAGLAVQLLGVLGVTLIPDILDRVHFLAASTLATLCIAASLVVGTGFSSIGIVALLLAGFTLLTGPLLSHLTAHAIHREQERRRS